MDALLLLKAVVLGIVEGLTEFLPVSSTGHLIIVSDAIEFSGERAKTFNVVIQLGAILGVALLYRARLVDLAVNAARGPQRKFLVNLVIASFPAALLGLLAHEYIKAHLFNPATVAGALITGGFVILLVEHWHHDVKVRVRTLDELSHWDALKIGIAQLFALFPGVSRSGATIMGGLVAGLSRTAATEFSFFLAIPIMVAATLFDLYGEAGSLGPGDIAVFATGFVVSFITALIVVRLFVQFISRHTFRPFAWYRIGLGIVVLAYFR